MKKVFKACLFVTLIAFSSVVYAQDDISRLLNEFVVNMTEEAVSETVHEEKHEEIHTKEGAHHSAEETEEASGFDPIHHVLDAHDIHLWGDGHDAVSVPLPIILWTDNGLVTFMSSAFHHDDAGHHIFEKNGMSFVKHHEKIYQLNAGEKVLSIDHETHTATNAVLPLDLSITKVIAAVFIVAIIMLLVFTAAAKKYKTAKPESPKGIAKWMEPLVLFVRDFAKDSIGDRYMKFMPYLLTVFFFIWFGNLLGLIPFIGGINMTGNIAITLTLALMTLIIQLINSKWAFWKHMLMPPGVPVALYPILVPIELMGILIKPAALTIRLFANITAGHIIVLSIIGIIFINHNVAWAGLSVPLALFISVLEITLVAFLQAYIFTMLSSMFIGAAVDDGHH
ncbi:ATP synthase F0 subunit A [Putridiphycobacter roseus]|uniref:ATP synthase subunit a n=1 Tax=Putridiphycobacter roseus TaxID=2219161 RepID=A0A2W1MZH2_9FLAO|nr:F0F1 ATP synthase subunit A [Putridiphycobacter roseus]PZE16660.1 ATP synthase F0 subunit A [Putridiphycobacter roseus]